MLLERVRLYSLLLMISFTFIIIVQKLTAIISVVQVEVPGRRRQNLIFLIFLILALYHYQARPLDDAGQKADGVLRLR